MKRFFLSLLVSASFVTQSAYAQEPTEPPAAAPAPEARPSQWYGWQTLIVDALAAGTMIVGAGSSSPTMSEVGFGMYVLAPPVVHAVHDRPVVALGDAAMRFAAPVALGAIGYALERRDCSGEMFCGLGGAALGAMVGYGLAVILDASALSWEKAPAKPAETARAPRSPRVRWSPTVGVTKEGVSAGVGGSF